MQIISDLWWLWLIIFLVSLATIIIIKNKRDDSLKAQFVVTGTFLLIFYIVCFLSGICNILTFIWRWML
jgi:hypothetical protein